jgi:hypothetical protein
VGVRRQKSRSKSKKSDGWREISVGFSEDYRQIFAKLSPTLKRNDSNEKIARCFIRYFPFSTFSISIKTIIRIIEKNFHDAW